jgi:hypothetical protein
MLIIIKCLKEMRMMDILSIWMLRKTQNGFAQGKGMKYRAFHFAGLGD